MKLSIAQCAFLIAFIFECNGQQVDNKNVATSPTISGQRKLKKKK